MLNENKKICSVNDTFTFMHIKNLWVKKNLVLDLIKNKLRFIAWEEIYEYQVFIR